MSPFPTVLFVCLHGSAKSVIAAHHLERLAAQQQIGVVARSAGIEPDAAIPPHVVNGLAGDGLGSPLSAPRLATPELLDTADLIVSFGCDLPVTPDRIPVFRWEDIPAVSDGYSAARDAIVGRLPGVLAAATATTANPPKSP